MLYLIIVAALVTSELIIAAINTMLARFDRKRAIAAIKAQEAEMAAYYQGQTIDAGSELD